MLHASCGLLALGLLNLRRSVTVDGAHLRRSFTALTHLRRISHPPVEPVVAPGGVPIDAPAVSSLLHCGARCSETTPILRRRTVERALVPCAPPPPPLAAPSSTAHGWRQHRGAQCPQAASGRCAAAGRWPHPHGRWRTRPFRRRPTRRGTARPMLWCSASRSAPSAGCRATGPR